MTEEVYSYLALGILKTEEMNGSDVTKIGFLQHVFPEPGVLATLFGYKSEPC